MSIPPDTSAEAPTPQNPQELYETALLHLELTTRELQEKQAGHLACKAGCAQCCRDSFKIRFIEALYLVEAIRQSPDLEVQTLLKQKQEGRCPVLGDNDQCQLYESRPLLCRAFGLILKQGDEFGTCELNYNEVQSLQGLEALDMGPYYELTDEASRQLWQRFHQLEPTIFPEAEAPKLTIESWLKRFAPMMA